MPPMDNGNNAMGGMNVTQNDMPPIGNDMDNGFGDENQEFDDGVEADSENEPKKYIQQLTGKLSQELRKYNQEQQNQDTELNKYVLGMLIPQASGNMTDQDKKEVIKKLQKNDIDDSGNENNTEEPSLNIDNGEPKMESISIKGNIVDELTRETKKYRDRRNIKVSDNPFVIK